MTFEFEHVTAAPVNPLATEYMVRMPYDNLLGEHVPAVAGDPPL
jgi:hypothetical protein